MAASAGSAVFKRKNGTTVTVDVYIPDATATLLTWNPAGLASTASQAYFTPDEDLMLVDLTTAAAPTAVGGTVKLGSGVVVGSAFRWADRLNTLSKRFPMAVYCPRGQQVSILQH